MCSRIRSRSKRHKATPAEKDALDKVFEYACCAHCGMRPIERHHVVPRGQGGDDVAEDLCPLCRSCHGKLEGHESEWRAIAMSVRSYVFARPERLAYVLGKLGEDRLDARYPALAERCARVVYRDFGNWARCNRQVTCKRGDREAA
jgi:hypothetical protein